MKDFFIKTFRGHQLILQEYLLQVMIPGIIFQLTLTM